MNIYRKGPNVEVSLDKVNLVADPVTSGTISTLP